MPRRETSTYDHAAATLLAPLRGRSIAQTQRLLRCCCSSLPSSLYRTIRSVLRFFTPVSHANARSRWPHNTQTRPACLWALVCDKYASIDRCSAAASLAPCERCKMSLNVHMRFWHFPRLPRSLHPSWPARSLPAFCGPSLALVPPSLLSRPRVS